MAKRKRLSYRLVHLDPASILCHNPVEPAFLLLFREAYEQTR